MKRIYIAVLLAFFAAVNVSAAEKMMCGAYIGKNNDYADGIKEYEELCGVKNNIYLVGIENGYPREKVLECYACGKIPMLLVGEDCRLSAVGALAEAAGEYSLPMYVCINGSAELCGYFSDIFRAKAHNVKIVQAVSLSDTDYKFAGIDKVDLLAVNATLDSQSVNYAFLYNMIENADVPVMINLAVSHYSETDHSYHIYEKIRALDYIYNMKENLGDKLFGINYINIKYKDRFFDIYKEEKLRTMYAGLVCRYGKNGKNFELF